MLKTSYTAESGTPGDARKRQLKRAVVATMEEFGFPITNVDMTRSRRHYKDVLSTTELNS